MSCVFLASAAGDDAPSWIGKKVYYREGAVARIQNQDVDAASARIPWPAEVAQVEGEWLRLGRGWVRHSDVRDLDELLEHSADAVRRDPKSAAAFRFRAVALREKGDLAAAVKEYDHAVGLAPLDPANYLARGQALQAEGDFPAALRDFDEAVKLAPASMTAYAQRGLARKAKGDFAGAVKDFDEAVRLAPQSAAARTNRGVARSAAGDHLGAVQDFDAALQLDPYDARAFNDRGNARMALGEVSAALKDYDAAIRLDPHSGSAELNRGEARFVNGDYDAARQDLDQAVRLAPKSAAAYSARAWMKATAPDPRYRDGTAAVADAVKACELSRWKDPFFLGTLAAAYAETGDFDKAVEHQSRAVDLYPHERDKAAGAERLALYKEKKPYRQPAPKR